ncbi:MAG: HDOD domain-containing protein [Desulfuromonadaceae bacterium]
MLHIPVAVLNSIESMQLQARPQILLRFLYLAEQERTTMHELAALVAQDPALSARILTVANSPALLRGDTSKNLTHCLVNIGTRLVRTLASCLIVQTVFSPAVDKSRYDLSGFWSHSMLVAEVAREIATAVGHPDPEEASLTGLLHDIGQLLLLGGMEECYGRVLEASVDEEDLLRVEELLLDTNHATVGAWLTDQWKLSSFMSDAILFHHKTAVEIASADRLSQIIWSTHALCDQMMLQDNAPNAGTSNLQETGALLGIDAHSTAVIYRDCSERVALLEEALGISKASTTKTFPQLTDTFHIKPAEGDPVDCHVNEAVREMALLRPLQHGLTSFSSEAEILLAIRESAILLFGPGQPAFLLVQPDTATLSGAGISAQPGILQRLAIPLVASHCLAAAAALEDRPRSTFETGLSDRVPLVDTQITRALGSEGVLYLPLTGRTTGLGVIAFGLSAAHHLRLHPQLSLMTGFSRVAAHSIDGWRDMQAREHANEEALTRHFEQQNRRVVHEAGNPLGIINNYLSIIRTRLPDTDNLHQELDILKDEIDRVTKILRQMSHLPERSAAADLLDINTLIESMLTLYGTSLFSRRGITVTKSLDPLVMPISCNRDSLKQVLVNLWNNASDAMTPGGCFTVSTQGNVNQGGRSYMEIRLDDTGPGLPADVMQRLFQPLPPDRRPGHSGIGLSIVASLLQQLEGLITCRSYAGRGTSFSILLPRSTEIKA